jgi:hypothetical protein
MNANFFLAAKGATLAPGASAGENAKVYKKEKEKT